MPWTRPIDDGSVWRLDYVSIEEIDDLVLCAYHEGGHGTLGAATGNRVPWASIVPERRWSSAGRVVLHRDTLAEVRHLARTGTPERPLRRRALCEAMVALGGRAGEELVSGEPMFASEADWFERALALDPDLQRAVECMTFAEPEHHDLVIRLGGIYVATLQYLQEHRVYVDLLASALLDHGTIVPEEFLTGLPPLPKPSPWPRWRCFR